VKSLRDNLSVRERRGWNGLLDRLVPLMSGGAMRLIALPRAARRSIAIIVDALMVITSTWAAYALRVGGWEIGWSLWLFFSAVCLLQWFAVAYLTGVYRSLIRFSGAATMLNLALAVSIYAVPVAIAFSLIGIPGVPRTFGILQPIILMILLLANRSFARFMLADLVHRPGPSPVDRRVLIYGAGRAGQQLAQSLRLEPHMTVLGFVDDDLRLHGQRLDGHAVYGSNRLIRTIKDLEPDEILLALPSASRARRREIVEKLQSHAVKVRSLPSVGHIVDGRVTINDLRNVQIEELLGREAVAPDAALMGVTIFGKTVLVSGAGGSIGSELCRQILSCKPQRLILLEQSELALFEIERELRGVNRDEELGVEIVPELGNVADRGSMNRIYRRYRPDTVFHAAAYKHVPLVEANPLAGLHNNVLGTLRSVEAAVQAGVAHFTLISTDKAVRPTNIMGASKRACELVLQAHAAANDKGTIFSMVRFGNVLGSSGSVVPTFKAQIARGGPVTVTDLEMTRYFMTIPEAAQLVIQASAMARGGEVFLLDMGEPVKIADLARTMISLSGLTVRSARNPDGDIAIEEIGLRPGEKLYEELLIGDGATATSHSRIMCAEEYFVPLAVLGQQLAQLDEAIQAGDTARAMAIVRALVPEYAPAAPT
jgi:FlaA1/EpsC-like NDP-sugar epimerase